MSWHLVIDNENRHFQEYLDFVSNTASKKQNELSEKKQQFEIVKDQLDQDSLEHEQDSLGYDAYECDKFIEMLYRSFLTTIFTFMESKLNELCDHIQKENNIMFGYKDLKGQGISRSLKYIEKISSVQFPKDVQLKEQFLFLQEIRNIIVHSNGVIPNESWVLKLIENNSVGVTVFNGEISLSEDYLKSLLQLNEKICLEIHDLWTEKL